MTDSGPQAGELSYEYEMKTAKSLEVAGRLTEARAVYERLLASYPNDAEVCRRYGRMIWDQQNPERAIELLRRATEMDPPSQKAHVDLAEIYNASNRHAEAETELGKALAVGPKSPDLYIKLALLSLGQKDRAKAYGHCEKALDRKIPPVGAHQLYGLMTWQDGDLEKAASHLGAARRYRPPANDPNALLASALFALGRADEIEELPRCRSDVQLYGELILLALQGWQTERFEYCRHALMRARTLLHKVEDEPRRFAFSPLQRILGFLLDFGLKNQDLYQAETAQTLFALGDNHCLSLGHLPVRYQGESWRIRPLHVVAGKAWHLAKPEENPQRSAFVTLLDKLPRGAQVLISFGDQDCRYRGGIQSYLKEHGDLTPAGVIDPLVAGYVERVLALTEARGLEATFVAPPAPNVTMRKIPTYERPLFTEIVDRFNERLRSEAQSRNRPLLDLFAVTFDPDRGVKSHYYFDGNHVFPNAALDAFASLED